MKRGPLLPVGTLPPARPPRPDPGRNVSLGAAAWRGSVSARQRQQKSAAPPKNRSNDSSRRATVESARTSIRPMR